MPSLTEEQFAVSSADPSLCGDLKYLPINQKMPKTELGVKVLLRSRCVDGQCGCLPTGRCNDSEVLQFPFPVSQDQEG